jgi:hypothetical protein
MAAASKAAAAWHRRNGESEEISLHRQQKIGVKINEETNEKMETKVKSSEESGDDGKRQQRRQICRSRRSRVAHRGGATAYALTRAAHRVNGSEKRHGARLCLFIAAPYHRHRCHISWHQQALVSSISRIAP